MQRFDGGKICDNMFLNNSEGSLYLVTSDKNIISGNFFELGDYNGDAFDSINLDTCIHNLISGNYIYGTNAWIRHGINETDGNSNHNYITGNYIKEVVGTAIVKNGANTIVKDNWGWITENSGTATILNGGSTIVVPHGLNGTPTIFNLSGSHAEVQSLYVTAVDATNFTINTADGNVTANRDIYWEAKAR